VQLPFVAPAAPTKPSPLDLAVRAQQAKARGKALAEQRRTKVLEEKEEQLAALRELQAGVRFVTLLLLLLHVTSDSGTQLVAVMCVLRPGAH
jgi:hypothetical protein